MNSQPRTRRPIWLGLAVAAALLAVTTGARAQEVSASLESTAGDAGPDVRFTTSTFGLFGQIPLAGKAVGDYSLYEIFDIEIDRLGADTFDQGRIVARGWGRLQLGDNTEINNSTADLGLLYFEGLTGPVTLRVGRQHVLEGLGRMSMIDGVNVRTFGPAGLQAQGFFGAIVPERFDYRGGGWQAGGRVAYAFAVPAEVGITFSHRNRDGQLSSEQLGLDGYAQIGILRLLWRAAMAPREASFVEGRLAATVQVLESLRLTVDYERVRPDMFLSRTSIFAAFADAAHDAFGGDAYWSPSPYYDVLFAGYGLRLDNSALGYRLSLRARAYRDPSHRSYVGAAVNRVKEQDNAYTSGRLYTSLRVIDPLSVAADAFAYAYDDAIRGVTNSYLGTVSLIWQIASSMQLSSTLGMGKTPSASFELNGGLRFTYGYGLDVGREQWP